MKVGVCVAHRAGGALTMTLPVRTETPRNSRDRFIACFIEPPAQPPCTFSSTSGCRKAATPVELLVTLGGGGYETLSYHVWKEKNKREKQKKASLPPLYISLTEPIFITRVCPLT